MALWLVSVFVAGLCLGWVAKTAALVNSVEVRRSHDHYLVYFGPRIVFRTGRKGVAHHAAARFQATIKGRKFHGDSEDQEGSASTGGA